MTSLCEVTFEDCPSDPDWCVDIKSELCAMTTEELWWAAATGRVSRETRAWRLGLEAWERLCDIPELAVAFEPEPAGDTGVTPPAVEITSLPAPNTGGCAINPPAWGQEEISDADEPWHGPFTSWVRGLVLEARWVFAGAAVGVASVALSVAGTTPQAEVAVAKASASSAVAGTVIAAAQAMAPRRPAIERVAAHGPTELGQKRLRSGRNQGKRP